MIQLSDNHWNCLRWKQQRRSTQSQRMKFNRSLTFLYFATRKNLISLKWWITVWPVRDHTFMMHLNNRSVVHMRMVGWEGSKNWVFFVDVMNRWLVSHGAATFEWNHVKNLSPIPKTQKLPDNMSTSIVDAMHAARMISVADLKLCTFKLWAIEIMNYLSSMPGNNLHVIFDNSSL